MKIAIGADHGGYKIKEFLAKYLKKKGHAVKDFGTYSLESCDYPVFSYEVAREVAKGAAKRGILICKTGIGSAIAANKVKGARAAVCNSMLAAQMSRRHNDANILVFGSRFVSVSKAAKIAGVWLKTEFEGGRHKRRVDEIKDIENGKIKKIRS